jgi:hypothetical protein
MSTLSSILARLERLERALARIAPDDDECAAVMRLRDRLEVMATRLRESASW